MIVTKFLYSLMCRKGPYKCPACNVGKVVRCLTEDAPSEHYFRWRCKDCWAEFGTEWVERIHGPSEPPTMLSLPPWKPEGEPAVRLTVEISTHAWRMFLVASVLLATFLASRVMLLAKGIVGLD